jgi:CIC family chloride channel protein
MQAGTRQIEQEESHRVGRLQLSLLGLVVGIVTGGGSVLFRLLIGLVHNLLFLGQLSASYDANLFTPGSPWGIGVILVPVIGGLGVTFLVSNFAPEAKGHGVPEVIDAVYYKSGVIRPVVVLVKSLATALAIGSGAAVGREGPIIQIGSALGSTLGQIARMTAGQRITLVAAGAGAGIAATFNTPIGGVMFAIELILPEIGLDSFMPVAIATGAATFIGRFFLGDMPAFAVPILSSLPNSSSGLVALALYALLGILSGAAAALFIRGLYWTQDQFDRIAGRYLRHALGMLFVGVLMYLLYRNFGQYFVDGVGYATIQTILQDQYKVAGFLALLFLCKMAATFVSLGSGSSGGIFSPSLFLGATLGACLAAAILAIAPTAPVSIPAFAMVGMGAVVGGATGAAMAAVTMVFEMTRDYGIVMPMILAVALSFGVRRLFCKESIYTIKLARRGHPVPEVRHANMFLVRRAAEVMQRDFLVAPIESNFAALLRGFNGQASMLHVLASRGERIVGAVRINLALRQGLEDVHDGLTLGDVVTRRFNVVREADVMFDVIGRLARRHAAMAVVVRGRGRPTRDTVIGVITKEHVADSVFTAVEGYR